MRTFQLDQRFDAVTCLFSSVGYMNSLAELDRAVTTMASHLRLGGVLIVDGWIRPDAWLDDHQVRLQTASDGNVTVSRMSRSRRNGDRTFLDMHHLIGSHDGIEYVVDVHEMMLFGSEQYERSLQRAGLIDVESIESPLPERDRYIGVAGPS